MIPGISRDFPGFPGLQASNFPSLPVAIFEFPFPSRKTGMWFSISLPVHRSQKAFPAHPWFLLSEISILEKYEYLISLSTLETRDQNFKFLFLLSKSEIRISHFSFYSRNSRSESHISLSALEIRDQNFKGAGTFHWGSQSKGGNFVLTLLSIRFSRNFYQIISGTKYE